MPIDGTLVNQLDQAHGRGIQSAAVFGEQHGAIIVAAAAFDMRLLNGFLSDQLFNQQLVEAKSAFHTPVENQASPLPTPPAK
jgi:hypothetical protein